MNLTIWLYPLSCLWLSWTLHSSGKLCQDSKIAKWLNSLACMSIQAERERMAADLMQAQAEIGALQDSMVQEQAAAEEQMQGLKDDAAEASRALNQDYKDLLAQLKGSHEAALTSARGETKDAEVHALIRPKSISW